MNNTFNCFDQTAVPNLLTCGNNKILTEGKSVSKPYQT